MDKKEILLIVIIIAVAVLLIVLSANTPKKLGVVFTEVSATYEDKNDNHCFIVHSDNSKTELPKTEYPPNLKSNGDWAYCANTIKPTILKDNEYFKTGGKDLASTSPEVKVKYVGQEPVIKLEKDL